jgi:hypothetical protein
MHSYVVPDRTFPSRHNDRNRSRRRGDQCELLYGATGESPATHALIAPCHRFRRAGINGLFLTAEIPYCRMRLKLAGRTMHRCCRGYGAPVHLYPPHITGMTSRHLNSPGQNSSAQAMREQPCAMERRTHVSQAGEQALTRTIDGGEATEIHVQGGTRRR